MASTDWEAAITALNAGELPSSSGERRVPPNNPPSVMPPPPPPVMPPPPVPAPPGPGTSTPPATPPAAPGAPAAPAAPAAPSAPVMHPALPHTVSDVIPLAGLGVLTLLAGACAVRMASRKSES